MKPISILMAMALQLIVAGAILGQPNFTVRNSKMTVRGTSSIHDWSSNVEKIECKGALKIESKILMDLKEVTVKIPVESIKSAKGKVMDNKTYEAFNYEKYPFILYKLTSAKVNARTGTIESSGLLTMAGVTRPVELIVKYSLLSNGALQIIGSKNLNMTDFKMVPPTAMMGTIKVGEIVTINFEIILSPNDLI